MSCNDCFIGQKSVTATNELSETSKPYRFQLSCHLCFLCYLHHLSHIKLASRTLIVYKTIHVKKLLILSPLLSAYTIAIQITKARAKIITVREPYANPFILRSPLMPYSLIFRSNLSVIVEPVVSFVNTPTVVPPSLVMQNGSFPALVSAPYHLGLPRHKTVSPGM